MLESRQVDATGQTRLAASDRPVVDATTQGYIVTGSIPRRRLTAVPFLSLHQRGPERFESLADCIWSLLWDPTPARKDVLLSDSLLPAASQLSG